MSVNGLVVAGFDQKRVLLGIRPPFRNPRLPYQASCAPSRETARSSSASSALCSRIIMMRQPSDYGQDHGSTLEIDFLRDLRIVMLVPSGKTI